MTIIVNAEKVYTIIQRLIKKVASIRRKRLLNEIEKMKAELEQEKQKLTEVFATSLRNLERKEKCLKVIYVMTLEIGSMYGSQNDRDHLYRFLFELIAHHLMNSRSGKPRVQILVEDNENNQMLRPYKNIWVGHSPRAKHLRIEKAYDTAAGYAYLTGECYFDPDTTRRESRFKANQQATRKTESIICIPIRCADEILGVLYVTLSYFVVAIILIVINPKEILYKLKFRTEIEVITVYTSFSGDPEICEYNFVHIRAFVCANLHLITEPTLLDCFYID